MNKKRLLAKTISLFVISSLFFLLNLEQIKVNADIKEIDINTSPNPDGYFFKVGDLKPGDWIPREITVFNDGANDFKYIATIGKKQSVKGLLEGLDLLIKKDEKVLYDGKFDEFTGITPRKLDSGTSETLFFQVAMPYELGNEFQSSSAEVEIIFLAEIDSDGQGGDNGGGNGGGGNDNNDTPGKNPSDDGTPPDNEKPNDPPMDSETPTGNPIIDQPIDETPVDEPKENEKPPGDVPPDKSDNPAGEVINITPKITDNLLPNTATTIYNFIFFGAVLLTVGLSILIMRFLKLIQRK
ncbi:hypothetical protein ACNQFZ_01280 [Schinkia sp. CFF1]